MTADRSHEISQRELRNDNAEIMRAVERGETFTITRNGTPIARVVPIRRRTFVPREEILATFATSPPIDVDRFRADLDAAFDQEIDDPYERA